MLPVQKKMDYRSRGIANGDTGDETGAKGVPPNLFSLKNDIKLAFINRPIRSEDFECWKRLKVSATRPNPNNDKRWGDLHLSQFHGIRKWRIYRVNSTFQTGAFLHDLEKWTFVRSVVRLPTIMRSLFDFYSDPYVSTCGRIIRARSYVK